VLRKSLDVITGLVPVISIKKGVTLHMIGMAGTRPAMTSSVVTGQID